MSQETEFLKSCTEDLGISEEEGRLRLAQGDLLLLDPEMRWTDVDAGTEAREWENAQQSLEAVVDIVALISPGARALVEDAIVRAEILAERARVRGSAGMKAETSR